MNGRSGRAFLPLLVVVGVAFREVMSDRLGVSSLIENVRARGVDAGVTRGVESSDDPVAAR
jgi:hypothetical protein